CFVDVGGEHLELARTGSFLRGFHERHGDGIGLLAGGTADNPDAERLVAALKELRKNLLLENVKSLRVPKKTRDADNYVRVKGVQFPGVASEVVGVVLQGVLLAQHHAPRDAPLDRSGFVEREIHRGMIAQEQQDLFEAILPQRLPLFSYPCWSVVICGGFLWP